MARKRDLTTKTDPKFGPWQPMRGARGQAEAVQQKTHVARGRTEAPLVPASGNLLQEGASLASRRAGRWRA